MASIRSPVCTVVGHVDHGKSTVLDYIRRSNIVSKEAGAITQSIGASIIPLDVLKKVCGNLLGPMKDSLKIPGLLFIDTPGHAAFTSLRKRGGNLADIAIVVIDVNEGMMPQTRESIDILMSYKTPFLIALNKIDLFPGFRYDPGKGMLQNMQAQSPEFQSRFETKMYEIVGKIHEEFNITCERFDRVSDYTKQIAMVPCSAKMGYGIPELLMVQIGLTQKFLEKSLETNASGPARGTVLEVKEERGLGITMDTIIYDGSLKVGDTVVIGSLNEPVVTKIKGLFEPAPLSEMRDKKSKFKSVKSVVAATGVKISAKAIEEVVSGMPIRGAMPDVLEKVKEEVRAEVNEVVIETEGKGVVCKADSLGSLEALVKLLREHDIKIRKASVGNISRKDMIDAESSFDNDPTNAVVLGFNVKTEEKSTVKVITGDIIYKILDDLQEWQEQVRVKIKTKELEYLTKPAKVELLSGYTFRQSNPALMGAEVLLGKLKSGSNLMKDGKVITSVKGIQADKKSVNEAEKGKQVAISMPNVTVGRQIEEDDILYTAISEDEFRKYKEFKEYLDSDTKIILKEIADIMREKNPVWGV